MTTGSAADDAVLGDLVAWLDEQSASSTHAVTGHETPAAGYSSRTILVEVARTEAGVVHDERLVLKLPPAGPAIFDRYDFAMQARLQEAASASGIPTATPARAEQDPHWLGAPFLVMPAVDGQVFSEVPALDKRLAKAEPSVNERFHGRFLDLLADIHRIDWRAAGLAGAVPQRDNQAELAYWRAYLDWYADGERIVPVLDEALAWCEANRPASEPEPSLLWGDVRMGNVIVGDDRTPLAVLDWEMATIGAAEHDLAWILSLDATQAALMQRTVPGFLDHDDCVARYEARLGRPVQDLEWYEILASVRSTAIMTRISHLNARRGEDNFFPIADNPILDLLVGRIERATG